MRGRRPIYPSKIDVTVVNIAIHCGPIGGGFGCDMGELPTPPPELAIVIYAIAAAGLVIGTYVVLSGRFPIRVGNRHQADLVEEGHASTWLESRALVVVCGLARTGLGNTEPSHDSQARVARPACVRNNDGKPCAQLVGLSHRPPRIAPNVVT